MELTQSYLKTILHYDPDTGVFTWLNGKHQGRIAGGIDSRGYVRIGLARNQYLAHRLAFLWMNGEMPATGVDHINGLRADNKWDNLRLAGYVTNGQNCRAPLDNTSGAVGVTWCKSVNKWQAQIKARGVYYYLGTYDEFWQAKATRKIAERKYGFHPNHGRAIGVGR